jgi:hypothetical protein
VEKKIEMKKDCILALISLKACVNERLTIQFTINFFILIISH